MAATGRTDEQRGQQHVGAGTRTDVKDGVAGSHDTCGERVADAGERLHSGHRQLIQVLGGIADVLERAPTGRKVVLLVRPCRDGRVHRLDRVEDDVALLGSDNDHDRSP
ncbi:MAG TPA: hypothetical protein VFZ72_19545 [Jiangellaceae bacterium]